MHIGKYESNDKTKAYKYTIDDKACKYTTEEIYFNPIHDLGCFHT